MGAPASAGRRSSGLFFFDDRYGAGMQLWIDTDTASDDAVALIIALRHVDVDVVGIGVVAGNVPLDAAVQNALFTRELVGRDDVPVYAGAAAPLKIKLQTAQNVHGADGMGDIGLDLTDRSPSPGDAVDALVEAATRHDDLTLVTLGPLTNIALAVQRDPSIIDHIGRTVVMGAVADHVGNVTPVAEFNMWADPHAVDIVLRSGLALEFVGWDISRKYAVVDDATARELRAIGGRIAEVAIDIQGAVVDFCASETGLDGFDLPDPIAIAHAIDPEIATATERYYLETVLDGPARGMVMVDHLGLTHRAPNATMVTEADNTRFIDILRTALG